MAEVKREYIVPLRRKVKTAPIWRRSKKAISVLKDFMKQHMKAENVVICAELNEHIWKNGSKNPPGKVEVIALRTTLNGVDSTLVNLKEAGIDTQLATYANAAPAEDKAEEVKDAEVTEVKAEEKVEETKAEAKEEEKETKKNE